MPSIASARPAHRRSARRTANNWHRHWPHRCGVQTGPDGPQETRRGWERRGDCRVGQTLRGRDAINSWASVLPSPFAGEIGVLSPSRRRGEQPQRLSSGTSVLSAAVAARAWAWSPTHPSRVRKRPSRPPCHRRQETQNGGRAAKYEQARRLGGSFGIAASCLVWAVGRRREGASGGASRWWAAGGTQFNRRTGKRKLALVPCHFFPGTRWIAK